MKIKIIYSLSIIKYYTIGLYRKLSGVNIFFLSAGMSFNGILCLIPLLLLITAIIGMILHSSSLTLQKINELLSTIFPPQPYAQEIKRSLMGIIHDIIRYRSTFGLYGIGILIWASASMFSSVRYVLNSIFQMKPKKLVLFNIIENIILVIVLGAIFVVANFFSWILLPINSLLEKIPEMGHFNISLFFKSITYVASLIPAFFTFFILYRYIPEKGISSKTATVAAITTTTLWWIASKGFSFYLTTFHPYSKLYGTYTSILIFLLWIYYSSIVFIVGAIVGQLYREKRESGTDNNYTRFS